MIESLTAWKQFECGLSEFKETLVKDKGALEGLTNTLAIESDAISNDLAQNVKEVAKRLSEKVDNQIVVQQVSVEWKFIFSTQLQIEKFEIERREWPKGF